MLERLFSKLSSNSSVDRYAAISQLSNLITKDNENDNVNIMGALTRQLAVDEDPIVTTGILDVIRNMVSKISRTDAESEIKSLINLQIILIKQTHLTRYELASAVTDDRGIPYLARRPDDIKVDLAALQHTLNVLANLKQAIIRLLAAGIRVMDMRDFYCPECDFSSIHQSFKNVNFDNATLVKTEWNSVDLSGVSFRNALLNGSHFYFVNLSNARIIETDDNSDVDDLLREDKDGFMYHPPNFFCSDLTGVDFEDYPLVIRHSSFPPTDDPQLRRMHAPSPSDGLFDGSNISHAKLAHTRQIILQVYRPQDKKLVSLSAPHQWPIGVYFRRGPSSPAAKIFRSTRCELAECKKCARRTAAGQTHSIPIAG